MPAAGSAADDSESPEEPLAERDPFGAGFEGLIPNLRRRYEEGTWLDQENLEPYRSLRPCPTCAGERLKAQSLAVRVKGRTISEFVNLPISEAVRVFDAIELSRSRGADRQPHHAARSATACTSSTTSASAI